MNDEQNTVLIGYTTPFQIYHLNPNYGSANRIFIFLFTI